MKANMKSLFSVFALLLSSFLGAQITLNTTHTNNNGASSIIFNVQNTNANDIIITGVNCHLGTNAANNLQLLYRTTPFVDNAAPWDNGIVGAGQNGWILAGSASFTSILVSSGSGKDSSGSILLRVSEVNWFPFALMPFSEMNAAKSISSGSRTSPFVLRYTI